MLTMGPSQHLSFQACDSSHPPHSLGFTAGAGQSRQSSMRMWLLQVPIRACARFPKRLDCCDERRSIAARRGRAPPKVVLDPGFSMGQCPHLHPLVRNNEDCKGREGLTNFVQLPRHRPRHPCARLVGRNHPHRIPWLRHVSSRVDVLVAPSLHSAPPPVAILFVDEQHESKCATGLESNSLQDPQCFKRMNDTRTVVVSALANVP